MALFDFLKPKPGLDKMLLDLIQFNADRIAKVEAKDPAEATYLAICLVLDDLKTRSNGQAGHRAVMGLMMAGPYQRHLNDVMTYLAWSSGQIALKPEFEEALSKRHQ